MKKIASQAKLNYRTTKAYDACNHLYSIENDGASLKSINFIVNRKNNFNWL
jgi:hypothetical protein